MSRILNAWRRIGPTRAISPNVLGAVSIARPWPDAGASTTTRSYVRARRSQRSSCASSQTFAIVISSFAPGAAATKYWNADDRASTRRPPPPSCRASHSSSARCGSIVIAHRLSASCTSVSGTTPWRRNARDTRSCSASSQTIVRRPACAAARPSAAATVVLPTPPFPVTYSRRLSRRSASMRSGTRMTMKAMDPGISAAYDACRRLHRRHDPTYYWATRRLPAEIRPATHALYGYVRTADEIVDGPRRAASTEARRAALDAGESEPERGLAAGRSTHPVVGALVEAGQRHRLPLGELRTYMRSMRIDCGPVRIETWPELEAYMDGSAGSVGRIMAPLLGVGGRHHAGFGRLGQAFQLANFIRDVREDTSLDRVYLPAEDRARFGVGEDDLRGEHATPELRALVALEVERARALFVEAAPGSVRSGIRFAVAVYLRVLDRVERIDFDVLGRRTGVRPWQLPGAALGALRRGPPPGPRPGPRRGPPGGE